MTRGNQRDLSRQKAAKKQQEEKRSTPAADKDGNKGTSLEQRKARDAEVMRLKQLKAEGKTDSAQTSK